MQSSYDNKHGREKKADLCGCSGRLYGMYRGMEGSGWGRELGHFLHQICHGHSGDKVVVGEENE
jgi:hypothetical protein